MITAEAMHTQADTAIVAAWVTPHRTNTPDPLEIRQPPTDFADPLVRQGAAVVVGPGDVEALQRPLRVVEDYRQLVAVVRELFEDRLGDAALVVPGVDRDTMASVLRGPADARSVRSRSEVTAVSRSRVRFSAASARAFLLA